MINLWIIDPFAVLYTQ